MRIAFETENVSNDEIEEVIYDLPTYNCSNSRELKKLIFDSIKTVHAIGPRLFGEPNNDLMIYYGRSPDHPTGVKNRLKSSLKSKNLRFSILIAKILTKHISKIEKDIIKIFKLIDSHDALCVKELKNISGGSNGPLPESKYSVLYLTFGFSKPVNVGKLTNYGVNVVLEEILDDDVLLDLDEKSIKDILNLTRLHSKKETIIWHPNHED